MTGDEEFDFGLVDDPTPPEPDAAKLQRAVARGRQRLFRRRAALGALVASVAFVLIGGGVAVAGRNDSAPDVQVAPTTTTIAQNPANVRVVDEDGVHYTLTLETPVVTAGRQVLVSLRRENRTTHAVARSQCEFQVVVGAVNPPPPLFVENVCGPGDTPLAAGASIQFIESGTAPTTPGEYSVRVQPTAVNELPDGLIRAEPFALRVLPSGGPTPTAATSSTTTTSLLPTPTEAFTVPSTVGGAGQGEDPRTPHAGDFSGSLTASQTSVTVGEGVGVELSIRNITDHVVEPSLGSLSKGVAIVCANDLSPLGHTGMPLLGDVNLFFVTSPSLAPGDPSGRGGTFIPTSGDVGTVTCAGVIIATTDDWKDGTISGVAQLANVPSVSFTVAAAPPETTTSSTTSATP